MGKSIANLVSFCVPLVSSHTHGALIRQVYRVCLEIHTTCGEHDGDGHTVDLSSPCSSSVLEKGCVRGLGQQMWTLRCVFSSKGFRITLRYSFFNTRPPPVVFRAYRDFHHERTTIPENTFFEWNGLFTQRVKRYGCVAHVDVR